MTAALREVIGDTAADRELVRALGSYLLGPTADSATIAAALGLPGCPPAEHTDAFVLTLPPFASIHLGAEGGLGGDGRDRVAGFWRALGLSPPADADHLGVLLALHAELGDAAAGSARSAAAGLTLMRDSLLHEHIASWAPGYLLAVADLGGAPAAWARLLLDTLDELVEHAQRPAALAAALRLAPPPLQPTATRDELLSAVVAPVCCGFVLTRHDLTRAAGELGVGLRRGERRFALRAFLEQDATATFGWLRRHAQTWAARHAGRACDASGDAARWWQRRCEQTVAALP